MVAMKKKMEGMVALVTGAGTGFGRAVCSAYAEEGAKVAVACSGSREEAEKTLEVVRSMGSDGIVIQCDAEDTGSVQRMVKETVAQLGRIDVLMNSGAVGGQEFPVAYQEESWAHIMNVNVREMVVGMQEAARYMRKQGYGKIINISSVMGLCPEDITRAAYISSKRLITSMTKEAAKEFHSAGIRVNCIIPGSFTVYAEDNPDADSTVDDLWKVLISLGYRENVDEMKELAVFLGCHESDYVDGECYTMEGGWM